MPKQKTVRADIALLEAVEEWRRHEQEVNGAVATICQLLEAKPGVAAKRLLEDFDAPDCICDRLSWWEDEHSMPMRARLRKLAQRGVPPRKGKQ